MGRLMQGQSGGCCIIMSQMEPDRSPIHYVTHQGFWCVIKMFSVEQCVHLQYLRKGSVLEKMLLKVL